MKLITAEELKSWLKSGNSFGLLDVREEWEHITYNIGGDNIPLGDLISRKSELNTDLPIVVYCEKGIRSAIAIQRLQEKGFENMYNLEGGMKAWRNIQ